MASIKKREDGNWRARYRDERGKEHARHFARKVDAQDWLDEQTAKIVTGSWVNPKTAKMTVEQWCDTWLQGYASRRPSTVRAAKVHIAQIKAEFGAMPLSMVRPSHVRAWTAKLLDGGYAPATVYGNHNKFAQIMADAVHDGIVPRSPCSRRTSPGPAKQRPYLATTEQVWALYDEMPRRLRPAILLGAFVGLRVAEACGLRVSDVDFMRGIVHPAVQYPADELKTAASRTPVPIPSELALQLSAHVAAYPGETVLTTETGNQLPPRSLDRAVQQARASLVKRDAEAKKVGNDEAVIGLPAEFRFHDLRHYFASLLIANGADVKVVQARLRHASATTTLNTYSHLWPDSEQGTRDTVAAVLTARSGSSAQNLADSLRTEPTSAK
jgi:integrase